MLPYPSIDPILVHLGPIAIRWYGLMYIFGFTFCYLYFRYILIPKREFPLNKDELPDLIFYSFLGLLIGGRLGYVLFYNLSSFIAHPETILYVWNGGLSFHGGLLGMVIALLYFAKKHNISPLPFGDRLILPIPIAIFLGRLGNFINGELYGKVVSPEQFPYCMVFPTGGSECRYPSQLIEGIGEGLVLFIILQTAFWLCKMRRHGSLLGLFLMGYGVARFLVEYIREPDRQLGLLWNVISMGQLLSLPVIIIGLILFIRSFFKPSNAPTA